MSNRNGLKCPVCKSHLLKVIDSRPKHNTALRRRKCHKCAVLFTTIEVISDSKGQPIKEMA
jgi:transcriptional regulator NrdR family protein